MAIRACREEKGQLLKSKNEMKMVKESLNDTYCDINGRIDLSQSQESFARSRIDARVGRYLL